ncbi:uncharacterized protein PHALS_15055 [Plasmopara halstedii]|uniref:Uncharacterized protein n=1 Tax=Plasmopara halstedii TaxID=4781 RepID=A0A0P1B2W9_PLAHL|nr:uncharacterized protein PHALS_15055 [Plasmopara halstedii]CEG47700.1 hypothetical protein PHALS_15055 [Plasmopara halstedii]|eukprot:XP_024584069.1 hypothetical protein PHALS_15055 [Plasmopara halstedii]
MLLTYQTECKHSPICVVQRKSYPHFLSHSDGKRVVENESMSQQKCVANAHFAKVDVHFSNR